VPLAAFPKCFLDALVVRKTMSVNEWVDRAAETLDIDGLEFYWGYTPQDEAGQKSLRKRVEDHGLLAPMMCYSPDFTKTDAGQRREELAKNPEAVMRMLEEGTEKARAKGEETMREVRKAIRIDYFKS